MEVNSLEKRNKYDDLFMSDDGAMCIYGVMDRFDVAETPTGRPKKLRCAYVDWKDSSYYGGVLEKKDLKELRKWVDWQIEHFDDADKEVAEI